MRFFILVALFLFCAGAGYSQQLQVHREVLPNGLTVLLYQNQQAPTVACRLFYKTGSVHEKPGNTGIAHMLEHMLFKGTKKVGITDSIADAAFITQLDSIMARLQLAQQSNDSLQITAIRAAYDSVLTEHRKLFINDELWQTYQKQGGTGLNAYTSRLMTAYFVTLPKNKVELFLWLESDRMQNAVLREFYPERSVVLEERRMRVDDRPTGRYFEALTALQYENHPMRSPVIGWPTDVSQLTRQQAYDHYRNFYKPSNAILVFAGDIQPTALMDQIKSYFGSVPSGTKLNLQIEEIPQDSEKRLIHRRDDAKPRFDLAFHTPAVGHKDLYALDIIEGVLKGASGRLYKRLVLEDKTATGASAGNYWSLYLGEFSVSVQLKESEYADTVQAAVWQELHRLQTELISPKELQKVKNQAYANSIRALEELETVATRLAYYEMYGDYNLINTYSKQLDQVQAQDVQQAAQKYFARSKSVTGLLLNNPQTSQE
jgi:predicted Zn-dependent peptidase